MAKPKNITTRKQAIEQLRATRAAGHYIEWNREKDEPEIGSEGAIVSGQFTLVDMQALGMLLPIGVVFCDWIGAVSWLRARDGEGLVISWDQDVGAPLMPGDDRVELDGLLAPRDIAAFIYLMASLRYLTVCAARAMLRGPLRID